MLDALSGLASLLVGLETVLDDLALALFGLASSVAAAAFVVLDLAAELEVIENSVRASDLASFAVPFVGQVMA